MKRCRQPHPMFPQVLCEEPVGHAEPTCFNSFYNRRWENRIAAMTAGERAEAAAALLPQPVLAAAIARVDDDWADAADWLAGRVLEILAEGDFEDEDTPATLGSCGCTDYHMADCPLVTDRNQPDDPPEPDDDERPFDEEDDDEAEA